jgi:NADH:ubiquinone oxidoreductase subunit H
MGYAGGAGMGVALPQSVYGVLLQAQGLSNTGAATYAAFIASPMWGILFVCLKCLFVFLLLVLVRVTTPKFKMETITKFG